MADAYILSAARTPIGKYLGALAELPAPELGARAVAEALRRAGAPPDRVDEVILGQVLQAGVGQNPARQAALKAGLPPTISAVTVNKVCGSGLEAVMQAARAVRAGDAELIVAGGMESMSNAPHLLRGARAGWKFGDQKVADALLHDGLWCAFENWPMGEAAEHIADRCGVTRADQDAFALQSQRRAAAAWQAGHFTAEVVPVDLTNPAGRGGSKARTNLTNPACWADEGVRGDTTPEGLAKLRPAFREGGTVTAGNSSTLSDGAAALTVGTLAAAERLGVRPLAKIRGYATSGVAPKDIFIAPVEAVRLALGRAGLTVADVDLFELNEAFAAQMVACNRGLELDEARVNVQGGAVALGHPIGASGARVLVTLLHTLARYQAEGRQGRVGVASLCLGGGNAVALVVERV